ncbi:MAG: phenylacetic acid degradation operon negative regulatory protein [Glaciecola sp.]|jgi:phenylacetic acid degradation operon negative regulatory protein|uniref:PaaX n=1 Tax=Congregibacter sp. TaxID=2744308 RepID=UPI0039E4231D
MFESKTHAAPTPKRLVLSLLSSPDLQEISAREYAQWGLLFGIDPTSMRVALGRLVKAGFLRSVARGRYAIGERGKVLSETARGWVSREQRIGPWDGQWLLVHTAHLGRRDKTALTTRERALALVGFATLSSGLWCRPANYLETPAQTRSRLVELGLESRAILVRGDSLLGESLSLEELWPRHDLESRYRALTNAMQESMQRGSAQHSDTLARETFLLGEAVIRQINSDPLLPGSMIDVNARRKMHETMVAYDSFGRGAWARFQVNF